MFGLKRETAHSIDSDQRPAAGSTSPHPTAMEGLLWAPGGQRWSYELTLAGALDLAGAWCLEAMLREVVASGARDIHLDMAGVDFLDSAGLRVLIQTRSQLSELDGRLTLRRASGTVRRLVCLADLCTILGLDAQPPGCRHNGAGQESGGHRYPAAGPIAADQPLRITGVHVIGIHAATIPTPALDAADIDVAGAHAA